MSKKKDKRAAANARAGIRNAEARFRARSASAKRRRRSRAASESPSQRAALAGLPVSVVLLRRLRERYAHAPDKAAAFIVHVRSNVERIYALALDENEPRRADKIARLAHELLEAIPELPPGTPSAATGVAQASPIPGPPSAFAGFARGV